MHADRGVAGAGATGDHGDAGLAGELAVGFRHVGGARLMARVDELDPVAHAVEGVQQREVALAGNAKGHVHAMDEQLVDEYLATGARRRDFGARGLSGLTFLQAHGVGSLLWITLGLTVDWVSSRLEFIKGGGLAAGKASRRCKARKTKRAKRPCSGGKCHAYRDP